MTVLHPTCLKLGVVSESSAEWKVRLLHAATCVENSFKSQNMLRILHESYFKYDNDDDDDDNDDDDDDTNNNNNNNNNNRNLYSAFGSSKHFTITLKCGTLFFFRKKRRSNTAREKSMT